MTATTASTADDELSLPLRAHLFFRELPGWWACSNPECDQVEPEYRDPDRRFGRLYAEPTVRCACGARCLDLWACQTCGEAFLGGYCSTDDTGIHYLLPDLPELEGVPADRPLAHPPGAVDGRWAQHPLLRLASQPLRGDARIWRPVCERLAVHHQATAVGGLRAGRGAWPPDAMSELRR